MPIPINDIDNKVACKLTSNRELFAKMATWANNNSIGPHPKTKFINT